MIYSKIKLSIVMSDHVNLFHQRAHLFQNRFFVFTVFIVILSVCSQKLHLFVDLTVKLFNHSLNAMVL